MSVDFGRVGDWEPLCDAAAPLPAGDDAAARHFFEARFVPFAAADYGIVEGLFTGYFEIELHGSRRRHGRYQTPIYRRPPDLGSKPQPARAEIDEGALTGRGLELLWVDDPIAAFFLQIQGSGQVRLRSGRTIRIAYDSQNGHAYVPVGRLLLERRLIPRAQLTMASILAWMQQHPVAGAALRREDTAYVFFREIHSDGPVGAEGVVLTAERSLAVDRAFVGLGIPAGGLAGYRRSDKGTGDGDFFWGTGKAAGSRAGEMNAAGRYYLLLPRAVARRLAPGRLPLPGD